MADQQWKKDLRPASFRGIEFKVNSSERSGGRRAVTHEFPRKAKPYTEDIGRKAQSFQVDAYVIGPDYMPGRDQLLSAIEDIEGPGELIHPYYGRLIVNCTDYKVRETTADGGMAVFSLTFIESGAADEPEVSSDTSYVAKQVADAAIENQKDVFAQIFSVVGLPAFAVETATAKIAEYADQIDEVASRFPSSNDIISDLAYSIRKLRASSLDLVNSPAQMAKSMADSMSLLRQSCDSFRDVFDGLKTFFGFGSSDQPIERTTSTRESQSLNNTAINDLVKVIALSEATKAAVDIEFSSIADATSIRESLTDQIDSSMDAIADDTAFVALQDLRTQVANAIPPPDESLPSVANFTPKITLPSLVITYDLYQNADMDSDIIARNNVVHPGFVPGGEGLEVLQFE